MKRLFINCPDISCNRPVLKVFSVIPIAPFALMPNPSQELKLNIACSLFDGAILPGIFFQSSDHALGSVGLFVWLFSRAFIQSSLLFLV